MPCRNLSEIGDLYGSPISEKVTWNRPLLQNFSQICGKIQQIFGTKIILICIDLLDPQNAKKKKTKTHLNFPPKLGLI